MNGPLKAAQGHALYDCEYLENGERYGATITIAIIYKVRLIGIFLFHLDQF